MICRFVVLDSEASALHALQAIQNKPFKNSVIHARIKNESRAVLINKMVSSLLDSFSSYNAFNPNSSSVFSSATMPYTASGDSDHAPPRGSAYPRFLEFHSSRRGRGGKAASRRRAVPAPKPIPLPQLNVGFPPGVSCSLRARFPRWCSRAEPRGSATPGSTRSTLPRRSSRS